MISTTMATALNEQIKWEMYSANLYLAMSAYLQDAGLTGFSHWMRIQYQEETAHALKFYDFLLSRGGQVTMLSPRIFSCNGLSPNRWKRKKPSRTSSANYA